MVKYSSPPKQNTIRTSGPNPYNYNVGRAGTLLTMMQTGGLASTSGGAALARALQQRSDADTLEKYQEAEAKRQGRGSLFGSIGGLAGGLLGAALAPATAGASLALGAGLGTALGKGLGERFGAGKARDVDRTGTVYGQESFRDVEDASSEYNEGMLERAGVAGIKAGLTAGLAPGGGMYGKVGGTLRTGAGWSGSAAQQALSIPTTGSIDTSFNPSSLFESKASIFQPSSYNPMSNLRGPSLGSGSYFSPLASAQNGGLIGMQNGGFTAQSILEQQGMTATPEQLKLFQSFDPSGVGKASQQLGQGLLGMTAGQGLSSGGGGFGAQQSAIAQAVEGGQKSLEDQIQDEQTAYQSQVLGTTADIVAGGGEFGTYTAPPPTVSNLPTADQGDVTYNGTEYVWDGETGRYITRDEYEQGLAEQSDQD